MFLHPPLQEHRENKTKQEAAKIWLEETIDVREFHGLEKKYDEEHAKRPSPNRTSYDFPQVRIVIASSTTCASLSRDRFAQKQMPLKQLVQA